MTIRDLPLFERVSNDEFARLSTRIHPEYRNVSRGESILAQNATYETLHALISGSCYAEMLDSRGKALRIESFKAPYLFAPAVLFASKNHMPGSVHAVTNCTIAKISRPDILAALQGVPQRIFRRQTRQSFEDVYGYGRFAVSRVSRKNDVLLLITRQDLMNSFSDRMLDVNMAEEWVACLRLRQSVLAGGCTAVQRVEVGHKRVRVGLARRSPRADPFWLLWFRFWGNRRLVS